ncbi:MAG: hypothetical protein IJU28_06635 [Clostridia bacterium]|nr:hypothetical protein [Clostridia bacterium]
MRGRLLKLLLTLGLVLTLLLPSLAEAPELRPPEGARGDVPAPVAQREEMRLLEKEAEGARQGSRIAGGIILFLIATSAAFTLLVVVPNTKRIKARQGASADGDSASAEPKE